MTDLSVYLDDVSNGCPQVADDSIDLSFTSPPYFLKDGYTDDLMLALGRIWARIMRPGQRAFMNFGQIKEKFDRPLDAHRLVLQGGGGKLIASQEIIWIKSIAVGGWEQEATCPDCGVEFDVPVPTLSRGHYQPIISKHIMHYCWEHVFTFVKKPARKKDVQPLNRTAIGVPFADKSNLERGTRGKNGDLHCAGDVWFIPREINNDDAKWLALLIDTTGHVWMRQDFTSHSVDYTTYLQIISESQEILKAAHGKIGYGELKGRALTFTSKEAASLLRRVFLHLLSKRQLAAAAIHAEEESTDSKTKERLWVAVNDITRGHAVDTTWIPEPPISEPDAWFIPYSTTGPTAKKAHRHQFPMELPRRAIKLSGIPKGSLVCDPFMGSGTTLFAARELGMRAVGFDICAESVDNVRNTWDEKRV
jgi:DNA modification methylase